MLKLSIVSNQIKNNKFKSYVEKYNIQNNTDYEISSFLSVESFYECIKIECIYNVVFLDLEIEKVLQVAYHIRKKLFDEKVAIVLMSSSESCSAEVIKIHPFDYLVYPLNYDKFTKCINSYIATRQQGLNLFKYTKNRHSYQISVSKIIYVQSDSKKIVMYTKNGIIDFYGRMADCINNKCFCNFIQIHKSFFVNPEYIEYLDRNHLILSGNIQLPVSRQKKINLKEYFKTE